MADSNLQSHQAISPMNRWVDLREFFPEDCLSIKNQGIPRLLSLYPTLGLRSGTIESQSLTMISWKRYVPQGLGYGQQHWRRFFDSTIRNQGGSIFFTPTEVKSIPW